MITKNIKKSKEFLRFRINKNSNAALFAVYCSITALQFLLNLNIFQHINLYIGTAVVFYLSKLSIIVHNKFLVQFFKMVNRKAAQQDKKTATKKNFITKVINPKINWLRMSTIVLWYIKITGIYFNLYKITLTNARGFNLFTEHKSQCERIKRKNPKKQANKKLTAIALSYLEKSQGAYHSRENNFGKEYISFFRHILELIYGKNQEYKFGLTYKFYDSDSTADTKDNTVPDTLTINNKLILIKKVFNKIVGANFNLSKLFKTALEKIFLILVTFKTKILEKITLKFIKLNTVHIFLIMLSSANLLSVVNTSSIYFSISALANTALSLSMFSAIIKLKKYENNMHAHIDFLCGFLPVLNELVASNIILVKQKCMHSYKTRLSTESYKKETILEYAIRQLEILKGKTSEELEHIIERIKFLHRDELKSKLTDFLTHTGSSIILRAIPISHDRTNTLFHAANIKNNFTALHSVVNYYVKNHGNYHTDFELITKALHVLFITNTINLDACCILNEKEYTALSMILRLTPENEPMRQSIINMMLLKMFDLNDTNDGLVFKLEKPEHYTYNEKETIKKMAKECFENNKLKPKSSNVFFRELKLFLGLSKKVSPNTLIDYTSHLKMMQIKVNKLIIISFLREFNAGQDNYLRKLIHHVLTHLYEQLDRRNKNRKLDDHETSDYYEEGEEQLQNYLYYFIEIQKTLILRGKIDLFNILDSKLKKLTDEDSAHSDINVNSLYNNKEFIHLALRSASETVIERLMQLGVDFSGKKLLESGHTFNGVEIIRDEEEQHTYIASSVIASAETENKEVLSTNNSSEPKNEIEQEEGVEETKEIPRAHN